MAHIVRQEIVKKAGSTKPKDLATSLLCYVIYDSLKPSQQANLHGPNTGYQNVQKV